MHENTNIAPAVTRFTCLQLIHAAAFEINAPGMRISRRGSSVTAARIQGLIPEKGRYTKKQVLELAVAEMKKHDPSYEPTGSVKRALDK